MAETKDVSDSNGASATTRSMIGYLYITLSDRLPSAVVVQGNFLPVYFAHKFSVDGVMRHLNELMVRG